MGENSGRALFDGGGGRIAGGQHRIDDDDQPILKMRRRLEIVFDRFERLVVAIDADMGDASGRDQVEHAVEQAVAGAQDRDEDQLLALDGGRVHCRHRRLDGDHFQLDVARHLVAHEVGNLAQEPPEPGNGGLLVAHDGQLVLDQRVIDDRHIAFGSAHRNTSC